MALTGPGTRAARSPRARSGATETIHAAPVDLGLHQACAQRGDPKPRHFPMGLARSDRYQIVVTSVPSLSPGG
jgi:hypothetical protein